ncbi:MAG: dihydroorotase [Myxococcales bacterium]|nr:dihydroorotase [Myxococcales bacterium]MCB9642516.1 dihydroorotase [Myxococcales bacterium]
MRQVIKNARIWGVTGLAEKADLYFREGVIEGMGLGGEVDRVWDAKGALLAPAFIDLQTHLCEPGFEVREGLESGLKAAVAGGFGTVVMMPDTDPILDDPAQVAQIQAKASALGFAKLCPAGALSRGMQGEQLSDMWALREAGVVMVTDGTKAVKDGHLFRRACEYAAEVGLLVQGGSLDASLCQGGVMHEGRVSERLGLPGQPAIAERLALFRDAEIARQTGARVHFGPITTEESLLLALWLRERGAPISIATTPHHLLLSDESMASFDPRYKVSPPLRPPADVKALRKALTDGLFDCLSTDHQPWTLAEKELDLLQAPSGIGGLETAWAVLYTSLVVPRLMELDVLLRAWTQGPAKVMGWPTPKLEEGSPATMVLLDLDQARPVEEKQLASKARLSPWEGQMLCGWPVATFVEGRCSFLREENGLSREGFLGH